MYLLGIDIGTSSVKTLIWDADTGQARGVSGGHRSSRPSDDASFRRSARILSMRDRSEKGPPS